MDDLKSAVGDKTWWLEVQLPHAFSCGDGLGLRYKSESWEDQGMVEGHACLELLCYLVVSAPCRVRLLPKAFRGGAPTVESFKKLAIDFARGLAGDRLVGDRLSLLGSFAMSALPPQVAWSGGSNTPAVGGDINDEAVLNILRDLKVNKEYTSAEKGRKVSKAVGLALGAVLPKGGLLPFLQRFPQYFQVSLTGEMTTVKKTEAHLQLHNVACHQRGNSNSRASRWRHNTRHNSRASC